MSNDKSGAPGRDRSFDIVRGICIIFMIMGHIGFGSFFSKYIHAFHVPIFFLISGYFYKQGAVWPRIKKRFSTLIVPYLVFGFFHLLIYWAIEGISFRELVWGTDSMLYHLLVMNSLPLPIAGALWFLIASFLSDTMVNVIYNVIKSEPARHIVIVALSAVGMFWSRLFGFRPPECLDIALANLVVFDAGICLGKYRENKVTGRAMDLSWAALVPLFAASAALITVCQTINVKQGRFGTGIMYVINVLLAFFVYISLARRLDGVRPLDRPCAFLRYIGRNSIIYLCFNQLCIRLFRILSAYIFPEKTGGAVKLALNAASLAVTVAVLTLLSMLFERNRTLGKIIGRKDIPMIAEGRRNEN